MRASRYCAHPSRWPFPPDSARAPVHDPAQPRPHISICVAVFVSVDVALSIRLVYFCLLWRLLIGVGFFKENTAPYQPTLSLLSDSDMNAKMKNTTSSSIKHMRSLLTHISNKIPCHTSLVDFERSIAPGTCQPIKTIIEYCGSGECDHSLRGLGNEGQIMIAIERE